MKKIKLLCLVLLPLLFAWSCKNESGMPAGNWGFVVSIEGSKQGDSLSVEYGAGQITYSDGRFSGVIMNTRFFVRVKAT